MLIVEGIVNRLQLAKDREGCTDEVKIAAPTSAEEGARRLISSVADRGPTSVEGGDAFTCYRCGTADSSLSACLQLPGNQDVPTPRAMTTGSFNSSHGTHQLRYGGGLACCLACGGSAATYHTRSLLCQACGSRR